MKLTNQKGNTFIISIFIIAIILVIFILIIAIYFGIINSILYDIKLDMYSINKSAIIAVNKGVTSRSGKLNYDVDDLKKYFKEQLKSNYNLDDNLRNNDGLIQNVEIIEYEILRSGKKDSVTNKKSQGTTIHSVIKVKVKPLILKDALKDKFTFDVHEDVALNKINI